MNDSFVTKIGWFASMTAIIMYSSYIDQIRLNLAGNHGSVILPIATTINCISWVCYSLFKENKDWPLFVCNALGIVLGAVTTFTAIVY